MGKKSKPKTPDVVGAAQAEGQMSENQARQTTYADRPDQYNPFGSLTYGQEAYIDPATGQRVTKWTQGQGLSPDMQKNFDQQMKYQKGLGGLQSGMMNRIKGEMGGAPEWGQFGQGQGLEYNPDELRQRAEDDAYGRSTSRLDPQFNQAAEQLEIKMRNQGLRAGDQAYEAEMDRFNRSKGDAYEQARMGATGEGRQEAGQLYDQQMSSTQEANALRDKQIQEYIQKRGYSLGESQSLNQAQSQGLQDMTQTYGGGGG